MFLWDLIPCTVFYDYVNLRVKLLNTEMKETKNVRTVYLVENNKFSFCKIAYPSSDVTLLQFYIGEYVLVLINFQDIRCKL